MVLPHTKRTFLSHPSVDLMWDLFLWENIMLTEQVVGRETLSWLSTFTNTRERWGQAALGERNLCRLSKSLGTVVRHQPCEAETVSHSAVITVWLDHCAWENANTLVISSLGTVLAMSVHFPSPARVSRCLLLWSLWVPVTIESWITSSGLSLTGESAQKGSFFSNLPLKQ